VWCEPLFRKTPLQEGDTSGHVSQPVNPSRGIPASKDLTESSREVIAVSVHKVVSVPTIFLAQLFKDLLHLLLGEVGVAKV